MVARAYSDAGSRPVFSRLRTDRHTVSHSVTEQATGRGSQPSCTYQSISPWSVALPRCTLRLCPRPTIFPSITRTDPMGIPPSSRPISASRRASAKNSTSIARVSAVAVAAGSVGVATAAIALAVSLPWRFRQSRDLPMAQDPEGLDRETEKWCSCSLQLGT